MPETVLPAHQGRSRETLIRLMRATVLLLDEIGLEGATIPRIAARAGLTPGAIYRRFPDKDALLRAVCVQVFDENARQTHELLKPELWKGKSLSEMCRFVIRTTLRGYSEHRGLLRALMSFTLEHPDATFVRQASELQLKVFRNTCNFLLAERTEIRHPDPDYAVAFALSIVGAAARGMLLSSRQPKGMARSVPDDEDRLQQELAKMILSYLRIES
jgi:AcrR family transcriptional regulator